MPDRLERYLRAASIGLAGVLALRLLFLMFRPDPLAGLRVPYPPHWQPAEPAKAATNDVGKTVSQIRSNSAVAGLTSTNLTATNPPPTDRPRTNASGTNAPRIAGTSPAGTLPPGVMPAGMPPGLPPGMSLGGPGAMRGGGASKPARPLSPIVQARIDRITQSEMLAPVQRPPPMALLGIAGRDAFIRTPSGQTALLREGAEKDGIKLLRIGTNRVLLEQGGEKKELIIFSGLGSESLLPK